MGDYVCRCGHRAGEHTNVGDGAECDKCNCDKFVFNGIETIISKKDWEQMKKNSHMPRDFYEEHQLHYIFGDHPEEETRRIRIIGI